MYGKIPVFSVESCNWWWKHVYNRNNSSTLVRKCVNFCLKSHSGLLLTFRPRLTYRLLRKPWWCPFMQQKRQSTGDRGRWCKQHRVALCLTPVCVVALLSVWVDLCSFSWSLGTRVVGQSEIWSIDQVDWEQLPCAACHCIDKYNCLLSRKGDQLQVRLKLVHLDSKVDLVALTLYSTAAVCCTCGIPVCGGRWGTGREGLEVAVEVKVSNPA